MKYKIFSSIILVSLLNGCMTYIERPTPTSSIAPISPSQIQQPQIQEIPREHPSVIPAPNPSQVVLDGMITREGAAAPSPRMPAASLARFKEAYTRAGKPKIAIYVNRTLSDDVREWHSVARITSSGDGSITSSQQTPFGATEKTIKGTIAVTNQTSLDSTSDRPSPRETYLWEFESGFMQPLVRAGAILVDRATILRLTSRNTSQQYNSIETKKNEMNALVNYADVFIEILITRVPSAPSGYEFKATAKETKSGRVLAIATSLNWDKDARPRKVIASDKGYEILPDRTMPRIVDLSKNLAQDTMHELIAAWGQ